MPAAPRPGTDGPRRNFARAHPFDSVIRRNIKLAESPSYGQSIYDYAPDSNGAKDYDLLAREIMGAGVAVETPASPSAPSAQTPAAVAEPPALSVVPAVAASPDTATPAPHRRKKTA